MFLYFTYPMTNSAQFFFEAKWCAPWSNISTIEYAMVHASDRLLFLSVQLRLRRLITCKTWIRKIMVVQYVCLIIVNDFGGLFVVLTIERCKFFLTKFDFILKSWLVRMHLLRFAA